MKLLLHTCCAPCLIYPLGALTQEGFEVTGFFYNPNIHPLAEYKNRKKAIEDFNKRVNNIEFIYTPYNPWEFFQAVNKKENTPKRCAACWQIRLKATAKQAKQRGFSYFSTTLLASPYQDQQLLKQIGSDTADESGIAFHYEDFRGGFRKAHEEAAAQGLYRQRYCGCIYSEIERDERAG